MTAAQVACLTLAQLAVRRALLRVAKVLAQRDFRVPYANRCVRLAGISCCLQRVGAGANRASALDVGLHASFAASPLAVVPHRWGAGYQAVCGLNRFAAEPAVFALAQRAMIVRIGFAAEAVAELDESVVGVCRRARVPVLTEVTPFALTCSAVRFTEFSGAPVLADGLIHIVRKLRLTLAERAGLAFAALTVTGLECSRTKWLTVLRCTVRADSSGGNRRRVCHSGSRRHC